MFAQIATELPAGVGDSGGPLAGLRIQHNVSSFDARGGQNQNLRVNLKLFTARPIHIRDALGCAGLIHQDAAHEGVCEEREILGGLCLGDRKPSG